MIKKVLLFAVFLAYSFVLVAQTNVSRTKSFHIVKEVRPPVLDIVQGSVQFVDVSGNNAIDANEKCRIRMQVCNSGMGDAHGCTAVIDAVGTRQGLTLSNKRITLIKKGETQTIEFPIVADMATVDGNVEFSVRVDEPNGFGTDAVKLSIDTRKFVSPKLQVVDYTVTGVGQGILTKKRPFDLQLLLQNTQHGVAENVKVEIEVPQGVFITDGEQQMSFATISGGDKKSLVYSLIVNNNYASDVIPIKVKLSERYGRFAENRQIDLKLNQTLATTKIVIDSEEEQLSSIEIASLQSAVDKNIPVTNIRNEKTFAVVVANERYQREAVVPFALNDGSVFARYCTNTLGLPAENVHLVRNATLNNIKAEVKWLENVIAAYNGEAKVIFYYAGHGIPDERNQTAYLLPVDGYGSDVSTGFSLDELYKVLGGLPTKSVTLFLDACFSGAKREGDMMASARGVAIRVRKGVPQGNMVVFSAAQGDETAYPYSEQNHGMFTYFLLKKLQDTKGDVTYQELGEYIKAEVSRKSIVVNKKSQTPTVTPSAVCASAWQNWKLK